MDSRWDTRHIHRLILDSSTYRLASSYRADSARIDPENRLWWRWTVRRLDAESIRDSMLSVAGKLDRRLGGESVGADAPRRSLYVRQKRDALPGQQVLFDGADGKTSCARRRTSTNALQPLWLLNSPFVQKMATSLAGRSGTVEKALEIALGREAEATELAKLRDLATSMDCRASVLRS